MKRILSLMVSLSLLQGCALRVEKAAAAAQNTVGVTAGSVPERANAGKYEKLLKTLPCPEDQDEYGDFEDSGHFDATSYCGQNAPAGYWVWLAPNWYIWGQVKNTSTNTGKLPAQATVNGKYRDLIKSFECPEKKAEEKAEYGSFADTGFYEATSYCGQSFPDAFWVYVAPKWYLWKTKDLAAIGYDTVIREVKLKQKTVTLRFEHQKANRVWAQTSVNQLAQTLLAIEEMTGIPYPGVNPYVISEEPTLPLLGKAGPSGMQLISPPKGTPWTILHEAVHIWNAGYEPNWVVEGHANYFSFLLMEKLKFPFIGDETYPEYIREWREIQGQSDDLPLDDNYDALPQGKAMAWWAMVHELYGPAFPIKTFVVLNQEQSLSTARMAQLLREASGKDPAPLLDGWIRRGSYKVKRSSDFGTIKAPLPKAWP